MQQNLKDLRRKADMLRESLRPASGQLNDQTIRAALVFIGSALYKIHMLFETLDRRIEK